MKLLDADGLLRALEALIVNRPSDPVANYFDGGVRTCIRVLTESPPVRSEIPEAAVAAMQERHKKKVEELERELVWSKAMRCPNAKLSEDGITFCDHLNRNLELTK